MRINGKEISVEIEGVGPTILLVPGLGGTSNCYQPQAEALKAGYRVVRVDLAGTGRSTLADLISIDSHADDLAALLDQIDGRGATAVGHSMSTLVVRALAARHPESVSGLVLLAGIAEPSEGGRRAQRNRAALLRDNGTVTVADGVVANALSAKTLREKPEVAAFVREMVMRQDPEGHARNREALASASDPGPIDPGLPVLLLAGEDDKVGSPAVSQALAQAHGAAEVHVIPGVGNWPMLEAPSRVTGLLTDFLQRHVNRSGNT